MATENQPGGIGHRRVGWKHDLDPQQGRPREFDQGQSDRCESRSPILAPVTGDQQAWKAARVEQPRRKCCKYSEQCIDRRVAGDMDLAADAFMPQIGSVAIGCGEQQIGDPVDFDPVAFLGPRQGQVVAAQPRLDMRKWKLRRDSAEGPANALEVSPCTITRSGRSMPGRAATSAVATCSA